MTKGRQLGQLKRKETLKKHRAHSRLGRVGLGSVDVSLEQRRAIGTLLGRRSGRPRGREIRAWLLAAAFDRLAEVVAKCESDRQARLSELLSALPNGAQGVTYREIDGFPHYLLGSDGVLWTRKDGRYGRIGPWKPKKLRSRNGYLNCELYRPDGARKKLWIHSSVLELFVGPRPDGMVACHNNDVKSDNRLENLRWDTHHANIADAVRNGVMRGAIIHRKRFLTADVVRLIRERHKSGCSQKAIAREFGCHYMNINHIVNRKTWKHVE